MNFKYFFTLFSVAILQMSLNSCGDASEGGIESPSNQIIGTWKSSCIQEREDEFDASIFSWTFFENKGFENSEIQYTTSDCSDEGTQWIIEGTGSYDLTETKEISAQGYDIDFTYDSIIITPKTEEVIDYLIDTNYCNINSWAVDNSTSLYNKSCLDENVTRNFPGDNDTFLNIVDISVSSLWLGTKTDHYTEKTRPTKIDEDKVLRKVSS